MSDTTLILIAEDDPADLRLTEMAFEEARLRNSLRAVRDGEELLQYLRRQGPYADPASSPRPGLILLDLYLPKKSGFEALQEIKSDPALHGIPVVVLTTSKRDVDVVRSYELGVNAFVTKPVDLSSFVEAIKTLGNFWLHVVSL
jgi:CheY-like chemotaxis protein